MSKVIPLTMFGTGQITLPKSWREQFKTRYFVAQEKKGSLVITPLQEGPQQASSLNANLKSKGKHILKQYQTDLKKMKSHKAYLKQERDIAREEYL